jgi:ribosomal protein L18
MLKIHKTGNDFTARVVEYDSHKHVVTVKVTRTGGIVSGKKNIDSGPAVGDGVADIELVDWRDRVIAWTRSYGPFFYADSRDRVIGGDVDRFTGFEIQLDLRKPLNYF